jgi:hypothetical protein
MKALIKIIIMLLLLLKPLVHVAQGDKVELLRVAFITKKVELTDAEAEKFWPVYNEYNDKIKAIRKNVRMSYRKRVEPLSEQDAEDLYQLDIKSKQAEVDVHKQYSEKIKTIIGVKKLIRLRVAEEEFKREMINTLKDKGD